MTNNQVNFDTSFFTLEKVYPHHENFGEQVLFLYELLKERDDTINISHTKLPIFENHVKFVEKYPYKDWYVLKSMSKDHKGYFASMYLTKQNEIGIFISKSHQRKGYASYILPQLIGDFFHRQKLLGQSEALYANINPKNSASKKLFEKLGFKLLRSEPTQDVYSLNM